MRFVFSGGGERMEAGDAPTDWCAGEPGEANRSDKTDRFLMYLIDTSHIGRVCRLRGTVSSLNRKKMIVHHLPGAW